MINVDRYRHRQRSTRKILVPLGFFWVIALLVLVPADPRIAAAPFALGAVVAVRAAVWCTMDTEITGRHLRAAFRPFGPARTIPLEGIISFTRARNPWYYGLGGPGAIYGLLSDRRGWCYEVWGLDAIEVHYRDDLGREQIIRIGTDDADGLDAALTEVTNGAPSSHR